MNEVFSVTKWLLYAGKILWTIMEHWYYILVGKLFCIDVNGWTNRSDLFSRWFCVSIVHLLRPETRYQYLGLKLIIIILTSSIHLLWASWWNMKSNLRLSDPGKNWDLFHSCFSCFYFRPRAYHMISLLFASVSFSSFTFSMMFTATLTIFSHSKISIS